MASNPNLPQQLTMSLGGESMAFTVQAEGSRMSLDEAVGSGLFELPDEPGMVRIPISLSVTIPGHLLQPPAADADARPEAAAAEKIAAGLRHATVPDAGEAATFRDMLRATRPGRGPAAG